MGATEEHITSLAPDTGHKFHSYKPAEASAQTSWARAVFYVIVLTTVFFLIAMVVYPSGETCDKYGKKMRGKIDTTSYGSTLFASFAAAILIVFLVGRMRR